MTLRIHPDEIVKTSSDGRLAIHESWTRVRLIDVADVLNGFAFKSAAFNKDGRGMPLLRIRDVGQSRTAAYYEGDFDPRYVVEPGQLVVGMDGDFRAARWRGEPALLNQRVCKITAHDPTFDPMFLYYSLPGYLEAIHDHTSSVTVKHLSSRTVEEIPLPLPPRDEQRRVVAAIEEQFSRLDAAVSSLSHVTRKLALTRRSVLHGAFAGNWEWTTLGEIADVVGGVTKDSKRQDDPSFVEVPYLRVANVQRGHLDLREITTIKVPPPKARALALEPGDLLLNEGGDRDKLGRGWIWEGQIPGCIHQNHVFRARLTKGFEPKFVSWHANTFGQAWFEEHGRQTTNLASLNLTTLKRFPVPAPPIETQRLVVSRLEEHLSVFEATDNAVLAGIRRAESLRRGILTEAFSGRLVAQDRADESAALLLDKITALGGTAAE